MVVNELESLTSALSGRCSNQLSYTTNIKVSNLHALEAYYHYTKESNHILSNITYLVGELRLELRTSASKTDVLTNYTAFPNEIVIYYIKVTITKNLNHVTNGKSILTYKSE